MVNNQTFERPQCPRTVRIDVPPGPITSGRPEDFSEKSLGPAVYVDDVKDYLKLDGEFVVTGSHPVVVLERTDALTPWSGENAN